MSLFARLSRVSRRRKLQLFNAIMAPTEETRILDAGAQVATNPHDDLQLIDLYPWKHNISAVNILSEHARKIAERYPEVDSRVGDARCLPWPDKHFDIVYSNAVIEHVGTFDDQRRMASEVMRVGKQWFVTTPNRWYPFEFHLRLPFVTWLPGNAYLWCGRLLSYDHTSGRYVVGVRHDDLRLMTVGQLKQCFPGSRIIRHRVTCMAETLIVVGGEVAQVGRARR